MIDEYLFNILVKGKKQTSYKFYIFKAILKFISLGKFDVSFFELGCMMIAVSYFDMDIYVNNKTEHDKLLLMKSELITDCNYYGNVNEELIFKDLLDIKNKDFIKAVKSLVAYAPYLILSYGQWDAYLEGLITWQKNKKIEELSNRFSDDVLYSIKDKNLHLNKIFVKELEKDLNYYNDEIDKYIRNYFN